MAHKNGCNLCILELCL